jgi:hypothetical protein
VIRCVAIEQKGKREKTFFSRFSSSKMCECEGRGRQNRAGQGRSGVMAVTECAVMNS